MTPSGTTPPWAAMPFSIDAHRVLADAVMDVAAAAVRRGEGGQAALVLRRALEVRRAGDQLRDRLRQQVSTMSPEIL